MTFLTPPSHMFQICSFNCNSLKNSLTEINMLCEQFDIVFLQETWLAKFELSSLNSIHDQFSGLGVSAFDSSKSLLAGRPYGGVAILWKKTLQPCVSAHIISERIMKIDIATNIGLVSLLNVYLPTDYHDLNSLDEFCMCIGQLATVLDDISGNTGFYGIIGDCNANSHGSTFFTELSAFCMENGLTISDVQLLEGDKNVHTFVSAAHGSTSWIDHCLSSPLLHSKVTDISVLHNVSVTDHLPLVIELQLQPATMAALDTVLPRTPKPNWKTANVHNINAYNISIHQQLEPLLPGILSDLHANCSVNCVQDLHIDYILKFYTVLVESVLLSGNLCIEPKNVGHVNNPKCIPGWNENVRLKHEMARAAFLHWRDCGSPKDGSASSQMRQTRLAFKYALRKLKRDNLRVKSNKLAASFVNQDPTRFWSLIRHGLGGGTPLPQSLGGLTGNVNISKMWKDHFERILNDNSCGSDTEMLAQLAKEPVRQTPPISAEDVSIAVAKLKSNKAPGWDLVSADHLIHMHPQFHDILAVLFNTMLNHSHLPDGLAHSLLVPLLKDKSGKIDDQANYRAIALSTTLSKVLELILVERLKPYLSTCDAQFGFKSGLSTTHATFALKETVNLFTKQGSPVYACFLDASKAFDRVCHSKLFDILVDRGVPTNYIKLLMRWYRTQTMAVKWSHVESDSFSVKNGVRQGGNLSPLLFNLYIDDLLCDLRQSGIGCHVQSCAVNVIAYADDIVLLSPTRTGLNKLVQKCELFAVSRDIKFNAKKSVCMLFTPQRPYSSRHLGDTEPKCIYLNGQPMSWVYTFKYLGHQMVSNLCDSTDMRRAKRALYYGTNMLCARVGYADKHILIQLFKAYCSSLYGCELWNLAGEKKVFNELCVAYHSCLKKLMKLPRWTRNHDMYLALGILPCKMLVASRQLSFWARLRMSGNAVVQTLMTSNVSDHGILSKSHLLIRSEYDLIPMDLSSVSGSDIRNVFVSQLERFVHDRLVMNTAQQSGS